MSLCCFCPLVCFTRSLSQGSEVWRVLTTEWGGGASQHSIPEKDRHVALIILEYHMLG